MLPRHRVETLRNLFQFYGMAVAMSHQNGLNKTVNITSLGAECLNRALC